MAEKLSQLQNPAFLFLTGMPAAGKTYWGEKIAQAYHLQFIDLDIFIEQHEKASIPALFAQYGEKGFRERESFHLRNIIDTSVTTTIVACGGGTPCFDDNMALMKKSGVVVYLKAGIDLILEHLKNSPEVRPLLSGRKNIPDFLTDLLQKRSAIYEQSHYILQVKDISLATFDKIISSCTNRQ
jgi:shikimate kinase